MTVEPFIKPKPLRLVSGSNAQVEAELIAIGEDYAPLVWNWTEVKGELVCTVVLLNARLIRQHQLAAPIAMGRPQ